MSDEEKKPDPPKLKRPEVPKLKRPEIPKLKQPEAPQLKKPEMPKLNRPEVPSLNKQTPSASKEPDGPVLKKPDDVEADKPGSIAQQRIFKPGERYGEFRVVRCLTAGLLANYYEMQDERTQETTTVGVFHGRTREDPKFIRRLRALEKSLADFEQEGIPKIQRCDLINEQHCVIMDPIQGQTLSRYFAAEVKPTEVGIAAEETVEVLARLMGLLGYAHVKGLDHRDMDSDLIFVDKEGQVSILGLGIKAAMGRDLFESIVSASVSPLVSSKTVGRLNSFDMISPEYREGKEETHSVDLFAIGMIGYWLLTSRKASLNDYETPSKHVDKLPADWDDFFKKLLKRAPGDRYTSCKLALVGLRGLYKDETEAHEQVGLIQRQIDRIPVPKGILDRGKLASRIYRLSVIGLIGLTLTALAAYTLVVAFTEVDPYSKIVAKVVEAGQTPDLSLIVQPVVAKVLFKGTDNRFITNSGSLDLKVQQGSYDLEFSAPNYVSRTIKINVERGEVNNAKVVLRPKWTDLQIASNPLVAVSAVTKEGGLIELGRTDGTGNLSLKEGIFSGTYTFIFEKTGFETQRMEDQILTFGKVTELAVELLPKPSSLTIKTEPTGATIFVDAQAIGKSPLRIGELEMDRAYNLRIALPGYREIAQEVVLEGGEDRILELAALEPNSGAIRFDVELPASTRLTLESIKKDLVVELDGARYNFGDAALDAVPEGPHVVRLIHPIFESQLLKVEISDKQEAVLDVVLKQLPAVVDVEIIGGFDAQYLVDGKSVDGTEGEIPMPSGRAVELEVQIRDHLTMRKTFELKPKDLETWQILPIKIPGPVESGEWEIPYLGMQFSWAPAGAYEMGSPMQEHGRLPSEGPRTEVRFTKGFWAGKYEVTQAQYFSLMGNNPSEFLGKNSPVESVSWGAANTFCERLTEIELAAGRLPDGYIYRLPTEYEWEYFARAGTEGPFHFGDSANVSYGNFKGVYPRDQLEDLQQTELYGTTRVGSYEANGYGIYDVHGNVQEWTLDKFNGRLEGGLLTDPIARTSGSRIAVRGGSWKDSAVATRAASRREVRPETNSSDIGFRVVLAPK